MSSETGLENATLIDMFRSEVEAHSESLSAALLALERHPSDMSRVDEMMRAAHSIKGAAGIVGVEPAGRVAHAMEDCLVAVQKRDIGLSPADIDVLLRGVDLLGKISASTHDPNADVAREFNGFVQELVAELTDIRRGFGKSGEVVSVRQGTADVAPRARTGANSEVVAATAAASTSSPGDAVTIAVPAVLDSVAAESIRTQILCAIDARCPIIRLDLGATTDLDVDGLVLLAAVPRHLAKHGRSSPRLAAASVAMETVLRVTGLAEQYGLGRGETGEAN